MYKKLMGSLHDYRVTLGWWWFFMILPTAFDAIGAAQLILHKQFFGVSWWLWFVLGPLSLLVLRFVAFHSAAFGRNQKGKYSDMLGDAPRPVFPA
jgi:hypothetical protein